MNNVTSLLDIIVDGFFRVVNALKCAVPTTVFGFEITWWELIISLFVIGTIINIITGDDSELED